MADQEGMPILHTLPLEKHSLPAKNIRIFHLTGTESLPALLDSPLDSRSPETEHLPLEALRGSQECQERKHGHVREATGLRSGRGPWKAA